MQHSNLMDFIPLPTTPLQYTMEFIESSQAIVLKQEADHVLVGVTQPTKLALLEQLRHFHQQKVEFRHIKSVELAEYLSGQMAKSEANFETESTNKNSLDRLANDAPIVNLVNSFIMESLRLGASDIHVEGFRDEGKVRYRLDGVLQTAKVLDVGIFPLVSSRIKIMADLNILEKRLPQDGRITVQTGQDNIDFRVSVIPSAAGESIVLRSFNRSQKTITVQDLGFSDFFLKKLDHASRFPNGIILVTGPTGSGKSTTLAALINQIKSDSIKVITLEDPVENLLEGVIQVPINEGIGVTFDNMLRRVLRQDPDVILVGEIRDAETAGLAVRAALTGHLVLATLHTNDALSAVQRLEDLGVEGFLLASVLRGVVAQRLIRILCPDCKKPAKTVSAILKAKGILSHFEPQGCPTCNKTGYKGRMALGEVFNFDPKDEEVLLQAKEKHQLVEHFKKQGYPFLMDDALRIVQEGISSYKEIERTLFGL